MVTPITQILFDLSRMIQQIYVRNGKLPEGDNIDTKYAIPINDMESAARLGLGEWVSVWDILKRLSKLSEENPPKN